MVCGAIQVALVPGPSLTTCRFGLTFNEREGDARKGRMLELTIYGLMGLAAMLVIAFYFAYGDEFPSDRETSSFDLNDNIHLNDSQMTEAAPKDPQFRRTVGKQQETAPTSLLQATSPAETEPDSVYSDSFQSHRGQVKVFHG
jgi:hypothetical protein